LLLFGTPAAAAEQLVSPALPGFVVGYEAANAEQSIREQIPAGETVQEWTRMVTTQRFGDAATRLTPTDLLGVIARNLAATCPGSTTSEMVTRPRNGHAAAQFRADCPLLAQTGKPETFIILVVAGAEDLHAKQVAFRRVPTAADLQWAEDVLAAVALCETGQDGDAYRVQD
jgi:hypothetical protein